MAGVEKILGFKDDKGEPMNEGAREFVVMVGASLYPTAVAVSPDYAVGLTVAATYPVAVVVVPEVAA